MNTKEAMSFLTYCKVKIGEYSKIDQIIDMIGRGEKYEEMWEDLEKVKNLYHKDNHFLSDIKQRYFPLPKTEAVLILSVKGARLVVDEIVERIKQNYGNSDYVDVKEGTRGEEC